jgi:putative selenate reductase
MKLPSPSHLADEIGGRWQYLVVVDLCNDCGNCMTFCPEDGDPAQVKPKLYIDDARFAGAEGQAFHLVRNGSAATVSAADGWDSELDTLSAVIAGDQGIPIRATDI